MNEIRRTVQRVDNPYQTALGKFRVISFSIGDITCKAASCTLFRDKACLRQQAAQPLNYKPFGSLVDIRYIVVGMLSLYLVNIESLAFLSYICASLTGYRANL